MLSRILPIVIFTILTCLLSTISPYEISYGWEGRLIRTIFSRRDTIDRNIPLTRYNIRKVPLTWSFLRLRSKSSIHAKFSKITFKKFHLSGENYLRENGKVVPLNENSSYRGSPFERKLYTYNYTRKHMCMHIIIHVNTCVYTHTCTHTYTHTYTHALIYHNYSGVHPNVFR